MNVVYYDDAIGIQDENGDEFLYWIRDEWEEDSEVVFSIVNAAVLAVSNPDLLRETVR